MFIFATLVCSALAVNGFNSNAKLFTKRDDNKPLILTKYIESGELQEGRDAAYVLPLVDNVVSYSGYFTVDKKYDSNLFFWYFPAEKNPATAPVVLWLQGGPGGSSLVGLFYENGPYKFVPKTEIVIKRDIYWSKTMHLIFIDSPVGTGFSFTNSSSGYAKDQVQIGNNLYSAILQFFTLFPNLKSNDFYITGESYAGKYVPALAYTIHQKNPSNSLKINLKGLAIGNGQCDPVNQLYFGSYLLEIGLIDENQKIEFDIYEKRLKDAILREDWKGAFRAYSDLILGIRVDATNSLFYNTTGYTNYYDYMIPEAEDFPEIVKFLNKKQVQRNIHVGSRRFVSVQFGTIVDMSLDEDSTQSVVPWLSVLMDNYKVLMFNGQFDIILAYPMAANYLNKLQWCGSAEFLSAERQKWMVEGKIAGYIKTSAPSHCKGSLSLVLVRNAGHLVPTYQPLWAYNLISNFTS